MRRARKVVGKQRLALPCLSVCDVRPCQLVVGYRTFIRRLSDRSSADVGCENDGYTSNVGEAGRVSSSFLKYSENNPLKDSSVGLQNFNRSGNREHEKALMCG